MGVGDLLRSSAAWRTLKNKWPEAKLHLLFLTKQQGYATEDLMKHHHLLASAHFIAIKSGSPHELGAKNIALKQVLDAAKTVCTEVKPDLIIDFEASGLRTSVVTHTCAKASGARAVGIASFLGRSFFYDKVAPPVVDYARGHGLALPMDYTERDYVALAALGLRREGQAIELQLQPEGVQAKEKLKKHLAEHRKENRPTSHVQQGLHESGLASKELLMGLNIGCGTPDALHKRPNLDVLADALGRIHAQTPFTLVLTGAAFERDINQAFIAAYARQWGDTNHLIDWSGQVSISGLTGVIDAIDFFISTDSGPYHMAVAQHTPTLVLFTYPEVTSYHDVPWCVRLVAPYDAADIVTEFRRLQDKHATANDR